MIDPNDDSMSRAPQSPSGESDGVTVRDIVWLLTQGNDDISSKTAKEIAEKVKTVIDSLGIEEFIAAHWDKIYRKLTECEMYVSGVSLGSNMLFVNMAIPLVNGIIHVASTRERLLGTTKDISKIWPAMPEPEKVPIVSALTLIYLVTKGQDSSPPADIPPDKLKEYRDHWDRMQSRVQHLLSTPAAPGQRPQ